MRFPEFSGEWENKRIDEIAPLQRGFDLPTQDVEDGDYPVVYSNGILKYHKTYKCEAPGLVTGRSGSIGSFTYISDGKYWPHNTSLWVTDFKNNYPPFIYYLYQTINISQYASGSSVPTLNRNDVHRHITYLPTFIEQVKIAKLLVKIDERIDTQRKIINKYESLIRGLTDDAFNRNISSPKISFSNLYKDAGEGGTPSTSNSEYYEGGAIPFIKIDDLVTKYLVTHKDCITEQGLHKSSAWLIPSGSVIYSNGATIGSISINTYPVCTKQGILGIIPKDNVNVEYLYYFMTSVYFRKEIHRIITEGTMKTAYLKDINKILCPLPCLEKQNTIANRISHYDKKIELDKRVLSLFQTQKKYLLSHLFI